MIKNFKQYRACRILEKNRGSHLKNMIFSTPNDSFLKWLRRFEVCYNMGGIFKVLSLIVYCFYRRASRRSGISIPKNVCDVGLHIPHFGSIVINANCRIGRNCMIQNNVNIGATGGSSKAPELGDNVYIGPGAVIYGDIIIADNCYIGANSVVNKSFLEPNSVIVGVPGKVIKKDDKLWWEKNRLKLNK